MSGSRFTSFPAWTLALGEKPLLSGEVPRGIFALRAESSVEVYDSAGELAKALPVQCPPMDWGPGPFAVLHLGADFEAGIEATAILGALKVRPELEVATGGALLVICGFTSGTSCRQVLDRLADAVRTPGDISGPDEVSPRTWIVVETQAALGITVGVEMGLEFNWVKEAGKGGLAGDLGLLCESATKASAGYRAAGRWIVVVGRESEAPVLRVRVERVRSKGLQIAFDAAAKLELNSDGQRLSADDFVSAVLGVHGAQLIQDLKVLEQWTDPAVPLNEILARSGMQAARGWIAALVGVAPEELDAQQGLIERRLIRLLQRLQVLSQQLQSAVLAAIRDNLPLAQLRSFLTGLVDLKAGDLAEAILAADRSGAVGLWLNAAAGDRILNLLEAPAERVRGLAQATLELLDEGEMEASLVALFESLDSRFSLEPLLRMANAADFAKLDDLLQQRLAEYLGGERAGWRESREAVALILRKRDAIYRQAERALQRQHSFEMAAVYTRSQSRHAMIDAEFDFREDVRRAFQTLLEGEVNELVLQPRPGIKLRSGLLTHGLKRRLDVEVTLPWTSKKYQRWNEALASCEAMEVDGRVLVYGCSSRQTDAGPHRHSTLSLALSLATRPGSNVRLHGRPRFSLSYSLRHYLPRMTDKDLVHQVAPLIQTYFPERYSAKKLNAYLDSFRSRSAVVLPVPFDGLFLLETTLSGAERLGEIWLGLGTQESDAAYQFMSLRVQAALKQLVVDCYFQDAARYGDLTSAQILLAWAAIAPRNAPKGKLHWNWPDLAMRAAVLGEPQTVSKYRELIARAQRRVDFFQPGDLTAIHLRDARLEGLLFAEANLISEFFKAGKKLAAARDSLDRAPAKAIQLLAEFGSRMAAVLERGAARIYLGSAGAALGTALFVEAMRGLSEDSFRPRVRAAARLAYLKSQADFGAAEFLETGKFPEQLLLISDQLGSAGGEDLIELAP